MWDIRTACVVKATGAFHGITEAISLDKASMTDKTHLIIMTTLLASRSESEINQLGASLDLFTHDHMMHQLEEMTVLVESNVSQFF